MYIYEAKEVMKLMKLKKICLCADLYRYYLKYFASHSVAIGRPSIRFPKERVRNRKTAFLALAVSLLSLYGLLYS